MCRITSDMEPHIVSKALFHGVRVRIKRRRRPRARQHNHRAVLRLVVKTTSTSST